MFAGSQGAFVNRGCVRRQALDLFGFKRQRPQNVLTRRNGKRQDRSVIKFFAPPEKSCKLKYLKPKRVS